MLDHHVRVGALDVRGERPQEHRVGERLERLDLAPQAAQRVLLLQQIRPQYLRHHHAEEPLVPDEVDLVPVASAQ